MAEQAVVIAEEIKKELLQMVKHPLKNLTEYGLFVAVRSKKVKSFSDLGDLMDHNMLGYAASKPMLEEMANKPTNLLHQKLDMTDDERKAQAGFDVINEAQNIVDQWIKEGKLKLK